jgi:Zn-dependent M28 family amino/carboxypeptidase
MLFVTGFATLGFDTYKNLNYLENVDSACKQLGIRKHYLPYVLPKGCYIIPQKEKFIWTVECEQANGTVFYVHEDALPAEIKSVDVHLQAKFLNEAKSDNLVGMLTGDVKDTFIAVTAHYDHLGMMGTKATFPGASDNASGTAMLLYLAHYFSTHPHHYSILFISFSGEEPGLLGSEYFIRHPRVPLKNIKFLTNIDIMGDATEGITVVNATEYPAQFALMQKINTDSNYIPQVKSRGKASNSDHYYFSEKGVPSFFIYSNGGRGYYHDIFDKPEAVTLNHIGGAASLLIDFMMQIK